MGAAWSPPPCAWIGRERRSNSRCSTCQYVVFIGAYPNVFAYVHYRYREQLLKLRDDREVVAQGVVEHAGSISDRARSELLYESR